MITNTIVLLSLLFGLAFTFIFLFRKDFRDQIERPKFNFQNQVNHFEKQTNLIENGPKQSRGKNEQ